MTPTHQFLRGMLFALSLVAAVLFSRFYKKTHDRFFVLFAAAFAVLAVNWFGVAFGPENEARKWVYVIRLVAFLLILGAIVDKNRKKG